MENEGHITQPPSRRRLLILTIVAFAAGSIVFLCFVLPAELHIDLTGFGRLTGLDRLAGPKEVIASASVGTAKATATTATPFRSDVIDIPLGRGDVYEGSELEYKVRMKEGDTLVYSWKVEPAPLPDEFYYDLHSQSDPSPDIRVISFKEGLGVGENGTLTAPFDGIHGWYVQNQSVGPVKVRLHLAGFYQLVSPEELAAAAAAAAANRPFGPPQSK